MLIFKYEREDVEFDEKTSEKEKKLHTKRLNKPYHIICRSGKSFNNGVGGGKDLTSQSYKMVFNNQVGSSTNFYKQFREEFKSNINIYNKDFDIIDINQRDFLLKVRELNKSLLDKLDDIKQINNDIIEIIQ